MNWLERTELLLGETALSTLRQAHVLVVGLGGVGAHAAEHLCRAGIGEMTLIDGDTIHASNRNRQLLALHSSEGLSKAECMASRLRDIQPDIRLHVFPEYIKDQRMVELLDLAPYDYVVDAIDSFSPKTYLIVHCLQKGLPLVSSMGSGGKMDPLQIRIADIAQTYSCPLADALRKRLHKLGFYSGFQTVFSPEPLRAGAVIPCENEPNKKSTVGTISYMPPLFGAYCASVVIRELLGEKVQSDLPIPHKIRKIIREQNHEHPSQK